MAILPAGVGYGIVVGFGAIFALLMSGFTWLQVKYLGEVQTSEMFMSANRSIKTGLTAAAIVSAWTWAATLLQSSTVAYKYGVSGPFWYASGATIQVLLFAILAVEVKIKAPNAHTFLEIMQARYGKVTHIVFLCFGLVCNIVVTGMLLLGGSAVVTDLTGMSIYAACLLIPVGVMIYVLAGGLKATFIADYIHTVYIYLTILVFGFTVYAGGTYLIGSPNAMFNLLNQATLDVLADKVKYAAQFSWLQDNEQYSYLTMSSTGGIIFGIVNIVGNFGTVFVDQAYWQRAVAARPSSTVKGYLLGGLCWFAIPFFLATTLGMSAVALQSNPAFPTYPNPMAVADVNAGLAAVNAAVTIFGTGGAVAILILIFMAVTSAFSAELIAASSLLTYDVYRSYIKPNATGDQIVKVSHINIVIFGIAMGVIAIILNQIGVSLGYLYLLMGILIAPAVFPVAATLMWKKQSKWGAIAGALGGFVCGIAAWLGVAKSYYGYINLDSTGGDYPMLAGNLVSLFGGAIFSIAVSLVKPDDYDFVSIYEIKKLDDPRDHAGFPEEELDPAKLKPALRLAVIASIVLTVVLILIWPLPMFFSRYVFSSPFFTFWVALGLGWAFAAALIIILYPLWESRQGLVDLCKGIASGKPVVSEETKVVSSEITDAAEKGTETVEKAVENVAEAAVEEVKA